MKRWIYVGAAVCLLVFVLPGSPIHLSYVYSDSMEPTIMQGDGYVLVPAGTVEPGDILTFYSDERGEYATHRVVGLTEDGFVTKGDNNPSTDQSAGYPPVARDEVLGKVATVGDSPLVVPKLGVAVGLVRAYWQFGVVLLVVGSGISGGKTRSRDIVRFRSLLIPLVVMAVVGGAAGLVFGAPTTSMTFTVTDAATTSDALLPVDESVVRTVDVELGEQPAYTHQFIETDGMALRRIEAAGQTPTLHVRIPAQATRGPYQTSIRLYRYPALLPYGVVAPLQAIHPLLAALATMSALFGPLYGVIWLLVDGKAVLQSRSRRRPLRRVFK